MEKSLNIYVCVTKTNTIGKSILTKNHKQQQKKKTGRKEGGITKNNNRKEEKSIVGYVPWARFPDAWYRRGVCCHDTIWKGHRKGAKE